MKKFLFFLVLSCAIVFSSIAFSSSAGENYRFYCSQCHGLTGKGDGINATKSRPVQPKDHTNKDQMSRLSDEDLVNVIRSGGRATSKSTRPALWGGYPAAFFRNSDQRRDNRAQRLSSRSLRMCRALRAVFKDKGTEGKWLFY